MDWYAPIARHIMIPLQARRNRIRWPWYVEEIAAWETLSSAEITRRQWRKMEQLLAHAYENVPYYRGVFEDQGLRPRDIRGPDDLLLLPLLTKQDIRRHGQDLVARDIPRERLIETYTGGTTGLPMHFWRDDRCRDLHYAAQAAFGRWYGLRPGDRQAAVWGSPLDLQARRGLRQQFVGRLSRRPEILDCRDLSEPRMGKFARFLLRWRPRLLRGYTHAVEHFARYLQASGLALSIPAAVCTAEPLSENQRRTIEQGLGAEVFDEYSGREFGLMATECRRHQGLHVNAFSFYLEVLAEDQPVPPGELGRLVGTDLDGYGMPLIRYDLGDLGRWALKPCECGIGLPLLASVEGRTMGMLVGPSGQSVSSGILVYVMGKLNLPAQFQFCQAEDTSIEVRAVPENGFGPEHEAALREALTALLGEGLKITIRRVAEIPRARSGKYVYTESSAAARVFAAPGRASAPER